MQKIEQEILLTLDDKDYIVLISVDATSTIEKERHEAFGHKIIEEKEEWGFDLQSVISVKEYESKEEIKENDPIFKKMEPVAREWVSENYEDLLDALVF